MLADEAPPRRSLTHAREMRRNPTASEALLWSALRGRRLDGLKFRRQAPIGPFIADFFCPEVKLVVEVDGGCHDYPGADAERGAWMRHEGLRVVRLTHTEVMSNLEGVLHAIRQATR